MKAPISALYSRYVIDGITQDDTPGGILQECMKKGRPGRNQPPELKLYATITDETIDLPPVSFSSGRSSVQACLANLKKTAIDSSAICRYYPQTSTKLNIASTLIDTIWREGHFRLMDLAMKAAWKWETAPVGNMAAFFRSAEAAGEYLYDLGVELDNFTFGESGGGCHAVFTVTGTVQASPSRTEDPDEYQFADSPFETWKPWIGDGNRCSNAIVSGRDSWLIYIPFDTCPFRLGGSQLSIAMEREGGQSSEIQDPDYFIDCFEVVRELVEDGVVISGTTVGMGGLMGAADRFCGSGGMTMDISGIGQAYQEKDNIRILFGEVPGAIIQIADNDYDYVDAQLLLQDIAYYPIGHPLDSGTGIVLAESSRSDLSNILESLIQSQASEGED